MQDTKYSCIYTQSLETEIKTVKTSFKTFDNRSLVKLHHYKTTIKHKKAKTPLVTKPPPQSSKLACVPIDLLNLILTFVTTAVSDSDRILLARMGVHVFPKC